MAVDVRAEGRAGALKALAEPVRWQILERLAAEELCVCHLVDDLGVAQPLVSHHLKVLRQAGLVESDRFRQWVYYRLSPGAVAAVASELLGMARSAGTAAGSRRPCCR